MQRGDIFLVYKDKIENANVYMVYDKFIGVGANIFGIYEINLQKIILNDEYKYTILTPTSNITWTRRNNMHEHLAGLLSKKYKANLRERNNFIKHIIRIYDEIFDIHIMDKMDDILPVNVNNILKSKNIQSLSLQ